MTSNPSVPDELAAALAAHLDARARFESLPPSHQREHVNYVAEAKKPETRVRRAAKCVEMLKSNDE